MRILARLILACGLTSLASAQTPGPKQEPAPQTNLPAPAQPAMPSQTTPAHLAGVEAGEIVRWTLKDAILAALEKNPDIEIARHNVRLSQFDVLAAQGAYDPITSSTLNYASQKAPNVSRFSGSSQNFLQNDAFGYNFGYSKLVERTANIVPVESFELKPLMLPLPDALKLSLANRPEVRQFALQKEMNELDVNISLPLCNHTAQANLGGALETGRQLDAQLRKQLQTIEADVRAAYHAVEAAGLRYGAARAAREYTERQMAGEQEKFSVGLSTTFLVLTRQNDLSQARPWSRRRSAPSRISRRPPQGSRSIIRVNSRRPQSHSTWRPARRSATP